MKFKQIIFSSIFWRGLYYVTVLLLNIIVSRYFQAKGSGWIYYISNYFSFILLIGSLCLESGMGFFASKNSIAKNKLALFSLVWSFSVSFLIILFLFFYQDATKEDLTLTQFLFFALTYILGILLSTYFCGLFYAEHNYALPSILLSISNLLLMGALAFIIYRGSPNNGQAHFLNLYFGNYLLQGIIIAFAYFKKHHVFTRLAFPSFLELKTLFNYSLLSLLTNMSFFLLYRIDYWFVKNMCAVCADGDLGNYIQVSKIGQMFLLLPSIIASAIFPRTAAGFKNQVNSWLPLLAKTVFVFYLAILFILIIIGKWFFPWVFGETFNHMYFAFILLIPGILSLSTIALISAYNAGKDKVKTNIKGSLIGLAIISLGDWYIIPKYGILGAATVSSIGYICYLSYLLYIFKKEYHVSIKTFFIPVMSDFKKIKELF